MPPALEYARREPKPPLSRFPLFCAAIGFLAGTVFYFISRLVEPLYGFVMTVTVPVCRTVLSILTPTPALREKLVGDGDGAFAWSVAYLTAVLFWSFLGAVLGFTCSLLPRRRSTAAARLLPRNQ